MSEKRLTKYKNNFFNRIVNSVLGKVVNENNALSIWRRLPSFMQNSDTFDMVAEKTDVRDVLELTKKQTIKNQKFSEILNNNTYGDIMLAWEVVGRDTQNEFLESVIDKFTKEEKIDVANASIGELYSEVDRTCLTHLIYENLSPDLLEKAIDINVKKYYQEPEEQERVKTLINEFRTRNKDLMNRLDVRILNQNIVDVFGKEKIEYITMNTSAQKSILECKGYDALQNFSYILNYNLVDFRERIGNICFKYFCNNNLNEALMKLSPEEKDKVISIITSDSGFSLNNLSELDTYYQKKKKVCLEIINNPQKIDEEYYEKAFSDTAEELSSMSFEFLYNMKNLNEIEKIKYAIIEMKYCMSYEKAKKICEYFGDDIDKIEQTEETRIVKELKEIFAENDIQKLRNMDFEENMDNYKGILNLYPNLKNLYLKEYQKVLYQVNENDFIGKQNVYIDNQNKDVEVKIYNAMGKNNDRCDFNMILTSLGGIYFHNHDYSDFKKDWDRADANHTISCSFIRNDFLGVVDDSFLLAFADISTNELLRSRNQDAGSVDCETAIFDETLKNRFLIPENQINSSKKYYNEMVVERKIFKEGKLVNRKPTYAVYFAEDITDINDEQNVRWVNSKRMAAELDIPIVVIDCKKCAELEFNKVQNMLTEFQKTKQTDLIPRIIHKIENNTQSRLGIATKQNKKFFNNDEMKKCLETIIYTLENSDTDTFNSGMDEIINVSKELNLLYEDDDLEYSKNQTYDYNSYIQRCEILKKTRKSLPKPQGALGLEKKNGKILEQYE